MAKEPRSLAGKVVAITGGARGIGEATARSFVREGAQVAIGDLDVALAEKTAATLGGGTIALELDVTDKDSFGSFLSQVEERLGPVDVLVNNAGIMPIGPFVEEDDATAQRMVDINIHGVIFGMKLVLPSMMRRNTGHIVNVASQAGKGGFPGGATYCGTKHAVVGISEAVRAELRETNIEVSCVMPAVVNTELGSGLVETRAVKVSEPSDVADAIVDAVKSAEVRRLGAEDERRDLPRHDAPPPARPRGDRPRAQGRPGPDARRLARPRRLRGPRRALGAGPRARER